MAQSLSKFSLAVFLSLSVFSVPSWAQSNPGLFPYGKWTVSQPIFQPGPKGTFDEVAVKDPTIVFYQGRYHMFYTSKATPETTKNKLKYVSKGRSAVGYVSAPDLKSLNKARRYDLCKIIEDVVVAPQVFYFRPHKL